MNAISQLSAERLVKNNGRSELLPTGSGNGVYHRILLGADFSPDSAPVFEHALKLAKQNNAELLILHSYTLPSTLGFMPPDCYDQWLKDDRAHTMERAKPLIQRASKEGVRAHVTVCEGLPENAIARAVKKAKIDLVVIGTHGRCGLSWLFAGGSAASRIMPRANCPVLIFPRGDEAAS